MVLDEGIHKTVWNKMQSVLFSDKRLNGFCYRFSTHGKLEEVLESSFFRRKNKVFHATPTVDSLQHKNSCCGCVDR